MIELLRKLTAISSPCGFEHRAIGHIHTLAAPLCDEIKVDGIGNVIALKKGGFEGPNLIVSAHVDEVGFIIKKIEPNGLLRFENLGGHDDRTLRSQRVDIVTSTGKILRGIIGNISTHMRKYDDPNKVRKGNELYIDCGASSLAEATEMGISIGDYVTWATEMEIFGKNKLLGKAFDDKAGCAVLLSAMADIDFSKVRGNVYFVFSTQEEVGLRGAKVAIGQVPADVALAVDTTAVSDTPENVMDKSLFLGSGVGIKVMDFSLIASLSVRNRLIECAKKQNIEYQLEVFPGIGTDAGAFGGHGIPSGVISIPSRYTHTPTEVIDIKDLEGAKALLCSFIYSLEDKGDFDFLSANNMKV